MGFSHATKRSVVGLAPRAHGTEENEFALVVGRVGAPPVLVGGQPDAPALDALRDQRDRLSAHDWSVNRT